MRLVLEEYLKTLREKDELDLLLCDLLLLEGLRSSIDPGQASDNMALIF